ncbi:MAG: hypothetical protein KDE54_34575, partial [Caldilineaceae bacterium]|nr:hypothetical protein [Caldilineaceae bacterium]
MPYSEHPLLGRARAKMKAERIINRTHRFQVEPTIAEAPSTAATDGAETITHQPPSPATSLNKRVFQLAWPVISENFLQTMLGIVDTLMVAQLGAFALAGVGTAIQIMFFVIAA